MLTSDQLARIVHDTINRMPNFNVIGQELLHVSPWIVLDDWQRGYCAAIGEAVARAVIEDREREEQQRRGEQRRGEQRRGDVSGAATH
jgi:hypothetical protein